MTTTSNALTLLRNIMKKQSVQSVAKQLNVSLPTLQRWIASKNVPKHYIFDLLRLSGKPIDYTLFTNKEKDQFFTNIDDVRRCWKIFCDVTHINIKEYIFIEPSAGNGAFLQTLPLNTIAMDVEPRAEGILQQDFLSWTPDNLSQKYVVIGNPPFGLRGHKALQFINHSSKFADHVCFILPQLFESDGKGTPKNRIVGYVLVHTESLHTSFHLPDSTITNVNVIFQVWSKPHLCKTSLNSKEESLTMSKEQTDIRIYSLSNGGTPSSSRNINMIEKCDVYLPSTCFGKESMKAYDSFYDLPSLKGYGLVFSRQRKHELIKKSKDTTWSDIAFKSTNSAFNLRTSIILKHLLLPPEKVTSKSNVPPHDRKAHHPLGRTVS